MTRRTPHDLQEETKQETDEEYWRSKKTSLEGNEIGNISDQS